MFSIIKILKTKFSFSSRNSRFWRKFPFLFLIEWDFANRFSSQESTILERKTQLILPSISNRFSSQESTILERKTQLILPSISLPIPVRNHIVLFGWILTRSVLQKGKVFWKESSVLLSNILTSVKTKTLVIVFSNTQSLFWNWTSELLFEAEVIFRF